MMKKTTLLGLAAVIAMSFSLQGCNDTQQAVAAGAIIGAAIGIAVSEESPRPPRRERPVCHGDYREKCSTYRDRYGGYSRECHTVYDRCAHYYELAFDADATPAQIAAARPVSEATVKIAQQWSMGFEGAEKISQTVARLKQGDASAVTLIGLSSGDLMELAQGRTLSQSSVEKLSFSLNLERSQTQKIVNAVYEKALAEKSVQELYGN